MENIINILTQKRNYSIFNYYLDLYTNETGYNVSELDKLLKDDLIKEIVQGLILVSKGKVHLNKMNKRCFCF